MKFKKWIRKVSGKQKMMSTPSVEQYADSTRKDTDTPGIDGNEEARLDLVHSGVDEATLVKLACTDPYISVRVEAAAKVTSQEGLIEIALANKRNRTGDVAIAKMGDSSMFWKKAYTSGHRLPDDEWTKRINRVKVVLDRAQAEDTIKSNSKVYSMIKGITEFSKHDRFSMLRSLAKPISDTNKENSAANVNSINTRYYFDNHSGAIVRVFIDKKRAESMYPNTIEWVSLSMKKSCICDIRLGEENSDLIQITEEAAVVVMEKWADEWERISTLNQSDEFPASVKKADITENFSIIAKSKVDLSVCLDALEHVTDETVLADISKNAMHQFIQEKAVERITDKSILLDLASTHTSANVSLWATKQLESIPYLLQVAEMSRNWGSRQEAIKQAETLSCLNETTKLGECLRDNRDGSKNQEGKEQLDLRSLPDNCKWVCRSVEKESDRVSALYEYKTRYFNPWLYGELFWKHLKTRLFLCYGDDVSFANRPYKRSGVYKGYHYEIEVDWYSLAFDSWKQSIRICIHPVIKTQPENTDVFDSFASFIEEFLISFNEIDDERQELDKKYEPAIVRVSNEVIDYDGHGRQTYNEYKISIYNKDNGLIFTESGRYIYELIKMITLFTKAYNENVVVIDKI